jgi:hypothetical protein
LDNQIARVGPKEGGWLGKKGIADTSSSRPGSLTIYLMFM